MHMNRNKLTTKLTIAEVTKQLLATPPVPPTAEQLEILRFGELNTFEALLAQLPAVIGLCDAHTLVEKTTSSNNRIEALLKLAPRMGTDDFLVLLGAEWSHCDYIFEYRHQLKPLLERRHYPIRCFMTKKENDAYDRLPEEVMCYRGAAPERLDGICWSMNRDVANAFPFTHRYDQSDEPLLATGVVAKADIIGLKLGREEEELVSFAVRHLGTLSADNRVATNHFASGDRGRSFQNEMEALAEYLPYSPDVQITPVLGALVLRHLIEGAVLLASDLRRVTRDDDELEQLQQIEETLAEADLIGLGSVMEPDEILESYY